MLSPDQLTILLSVRLIGGRQLSLDMPNHDSCHTALFEISNTNQLVGHWL